MGDTNYWAAFNRKRLNRRRLLQGTALSAAGLAGAALVGCGGGDEEPEATGTAAATGTAEPQVKKGGVFRDAWGFAPPSLDPYKFSTGASKRPATYVYGRLFQFQQGPGIDYGTLKVVPDAAESYEVTPDGLTYTIKLKGNVKFHPPLDRLLTAEDVVFSAQRFLGQVQGYAGAQNRDQLTGIVSTVQATDARTVVFKLKKPYSFFLFKLADPTTLHLMPKETGTAFNPEQTMVGTGPWIFEEHRPSVMIKYRRNPSWHFGPDKPYLDGAEFDFINSSETNMSQFLGGNLDRHSIDAANLKRVKDTIPGVQIVKTIGSLSLSAVWFSLDDPNSPAWLKPEVRKAVSLAIDRNALLDGAYAFKELQAQGVEVDYAEGYHNFIPNAHTGFWLNPLGKDSKVAANFKYDPEEAKRLLAQAGYGSGFSADLHATPLYMRGSGGAMWELVIQMLGKVGINVKTSLENDYGTFITKVFGGQYDGFGQGASTFYIDPMDYLGPYYRADSLRNFSKVKDPELVSKIEKIESSRDEKEIKQQFLDVQNYLGEKMYFVPLVVGPGFEAFQPKVRNAPDYVGLNSYSYGIGAEMLPYTWKDV